MSQSSKDAAAHACTFCLQRAGLSWQQPFADLGGFILRVLKDALCMLELPLELLVLNCFDVHAGPALELGSLLLLLLCALPAQAGEKEWIMLLVITSNSSRAATFYLPFFYH